MEVNPALIGCVSLITGFSGADRIFIGDYIGGIMKGLLFILTSVAIIYSPSGIQANAKVFQITQFLMFLAVIAWVYDCMMLFMKMGSAEKINNVFGREIVWKNSDRARYTTAAIFFFILVFICAFV